LRTCCQPILRRAAHAKSSIPPFLQLACGICAQTFECMRRLILGCVIGLADPDSAAAAVMGMLFSFIFCLVFNELKPFKNQDENTFSVVLSASLEVLFVAALMIKVDIASDSDDDQGLFSALLVFILFAAPLVVTIQAAWGKILAAIGVLSLILGKKTEEKNSQKAEAGVLKDQEGGGDQNGESKDGPNIDEGQGITAVKQETATETPSRSMSRSSIGTSLHKSLDA